MSVTTMLRAALALVLLGCASHGCASQPEHSEADPLPAPREATNATARRGNARAAPARGDESADPASLPSYMREHFTELSGVERDLVAGNLKSAKAHALELLHPRPGEPPGWAQYRAPLVQAARAIDASKTLAEAAEHAAHVVRACAGCHHGLKVAPTLEAPPELPDSATVEDKMRLHQVAMITLRTSLLFADDPLWSRGVSILNRAPLHPKEVVGPGVINPTFVDRANAVRSCAKLAGQRTGPARFAIYGDLLATCVACHSGSPATAPLHRCR